MSVRLQSFMDRCALPYPDATCVVTFFSAVAILTHPSAVTIHIGDVIMLPVLGDAALVGAP
jgi:hypothetical protein